MNIQSLSVVVPTNNKCVNKCKFCVSRTHTNPYRDKISSVVKQNSDEIATAQHLYLEGDLTAEQAITLAFNVEAKSTMEYKDYFNRLQFARDNGCNVVVLTGTGEPIQNPKFLDFFSEINATLTTPFKSIEMQTTGVLLDEESISHLRQIGVTTISLSISNIFDNDRNLELIGCHDTLRFKLIDIIELIKKYDFNLRLSLNLVNDYDSYSVEDVIKKCEELGADQVTFRKLYKSDKNNEIDKWIEDNHVSNNFYSKLVKYVKDNGKFLGVLPFGPSIYNVSEMSMVVDQDCMSEEIKDKDKDTYKYLILRENCRVYTNWSTKASLVF